MVSVQTIGTIVIKLLKLLINLLIILLYRSGNQGDFLGVGGKWNQNELKNPDTEILASGVFVGFFIYTSVVLISFCFGVMEHKKSFTEILMNFLGMALFIFVGAIDLHYWYGYLPEKKFIHTQPDKQNGLIVGGLCIMQGTAYLVDLILTFLHISKNGFEFLQNES